MKERLKRETMRRWFSWLVLLALAYLFISVFGGPSSSFQPVSFLILLAVLPVFLLLIRKSNYLSYFISLFVILVSLIAATSLILWIVGPILNIMKTNSEILSNWGTKNNLYVPFRGYYGLLYLRQYETSLGIWRNTGIFTEAPMYSYILSVAFMIECLARKKPRICICAILICTILSTVSTTGYASIILTLIARYFSSLSKDSRTYFIKALFLILFSLIAIIILTVLLEGKLDTSSGSARMDDFRRGYLAWLDNPVFGNGLSDDSAIAQYMSTFRGDNAGFSSGFMEVLYRGGLVFASVWLIALFGYSKDGFGGVRLFPLVFMFVFLVTIVTFLPLSTFILSYGVSLLIDS